MKCPYCSFSPLLPLILNLKTASDAAHYLLEEMKEPCKCLTCDEQFRVSFNGRCFGVSRNWRWGGRCCWEQVSETHRGFPQQGETLLLGDVQGSSGSMLSPDGSRWVRLGLWKWINSPVGPLYHSVSSLPKSSPLFPDLICTKEKRLWPLSSCIMPQSNLLKTICVLFSIQNGVTA